MASHSTPPAFSKTFSSRPHSSWINQTLLNSQRKVLSHRALASQPGESPLVRTLKAEGKDPESLSWTEEKRPPCFFIESVKGTENQLWLPSSHKRAVCCTANSWIRRNQALCWEFADHGAALQGESTLKGWPGLNNSIAYLVGSRLRQGLPVEGVVSRSAIQAMFKKKIPCIKAFSWGQINSYFWITHLDSLEASKQCQHT